MKILKTTILMLMFIGLAFATTAMAKVNLNTASKTQLKSLKGIGPSAAQKIIDYRADFGGFAAIEDVMHIKGIGQGTFDKFRADITVGDISGLKIKPYTSSSKYAGKGGTKTKSRRTRRSSSISGKINLNRAGASELTKLPRVGKATAQKIIDYRNEFGGFAKIEDIMHIRGIGPKTFEKMKDNLTVGSIAGLKIKKYTSSKKYAGKGGASGSTGKRATRTYTGKVNINTATASQLSALPGIGKTTAQRIIDYRSGAKFKKTSDIVNVKRIGKRLYDKIKNYIKVEGATDFKTSKKAGSASKTRRRSSRKTFTGKININTASASELEKLPSVGPATAKRIIDYRTQNGKFGSPGDITKVKGIGAKTFEKMKDNIIVE